MHEGGRRARIMSLATAAAAFAALSQADRCRFAAHVKKEMQIVNASKTMVQARQMLITNLPLEMLAHIIELIACDMRSYRTAIRFTACCHLTHACTSYVQKFYVQAYGGERFYPMLMPFSWAVKLSGLQCLTLSSISVAGYARLLTLLPAFPLLEELNIIFIEGTSSKVVQDANYLFLHDLEQLLSTGQLCMPRLKRFWLVGNGGDPYGAYVDDLECEDRLVAAVPPTAALWRATELHIESGRVRFTETYLRSLLEAGPDLKWCPRMAGRGDLSVLRFFAEDWPTNSVAQREAFETAYSLLVKHGANPSQARVGPFTVVGALTRPPIEHATPMDIWTERCAVELDREHLRATQPAKSVPAITDMNSDDDEDEDEEEHASMSGYTSSDEH